MEHFRIASNLFWAMAGKLVTLGGSLLVGILVARYLGPERYGLMNYVVSYVFLFQVLATFGLDAIEIREESRNPEDFARILGTAMSVRLVLAVLTMVLTITTSIVLETDSETIALTALYAVSMIANTFSAVRNYFTSIVRNECIAKSEISRTVIGIGVKLLLLWLKAPLIWFVAALVFDLFLLAGGYMVLYRQTVGSPRAWSFDSRLARRLLRESFPLLLTSAAVIIYQRIDQVMIGQMVDNESVGYFSVAARIVEVLVYVPMIAVQTIIPVLVRQRQCDEGLYRSKAQLFMNVTFWGTLFASAATSALSYWIIMQMFGERYIMAVAILQVLSFKAASVALSSTAGNLLVVEGLQRWAILRDGFGCIICVLLNYLLLPRYGAVASAVVAVLSNLAAGYIADLFIPQYRHLFYMQTRALFLGWMDLPKITKLRTA